MPWFCEEIGQALVNSTVDFVDLLQVIHNTLTVPHSQWPPRLIIEIYAHHMPDYPVQTHCHS